jgi:hypothetical protein
MRLRWVGKYDGARHTEFTESSPNAETISQIWNESESLFVFYYA